MAELLTETWLAEAEFETLLTQHFPTANPDTLQRLRQAAAHSAYQQDAVSS